MTHPAEGAKVELVKRLFEYARTCDLSVRGLQGTLLEAAEMLAASPEPLEREGLRDLPFGNSPLKDAAWSAFYVTIESELPKNPDGTHSGTFWVALMEGIKAYLKAAQETMGEKDEQRGTTGGGLPSDKESVRSAVGTDEQTSKQSVPHQSAPQGPSGMTRAYIESIMQGTSSGAKWISIDRKDARKLCDLALRGLQEK